MRFVPTALTAALVLAITPAAFADDVGGDAWHADATTADDARVETIPEHSTWIERDVVVPPVTEEVCEPVYETVEVPVYEKQVTPVYESVDQPVYETRTTPVYTTARVPVYENVPVTRYERREIPGSGLRLPFWNPFTCECDAVELFNCTTCVPAGVDTHRRLVGYRAQTIQTGVHTETVCVGTETKRVFKGNHVEVVQTGTRQEKRLTGYRRDTVVVQAATTRTMRERVHVPAQRVTVVPDEHADEARPLPGTERVVSRTEYVQTLAQR